MSKLTPLTAPMRVPTWVSTRRLLEEQLHDLHKCGNFNRVKQVHAQIIKQALHTDLYVVPKLISALSTCKHIDLAVTVFKQVEDPNVQLYNTLIRACVHNSEVFLAFSVFFEMQRNWLFPDNFTYPFLLKACNGESWLPMVRMIHNHVEKCGFLGDLFVPNALIDSYCKCGALGVGYAARLFASMEDRDVVSWNSMIGGLVKGGELIRARQLFDEMPSRDVVSWNTMLDGYAKAGDMDEAFKLFEKMPERNVVSWSTILWGFCNAGDMEMARALFDRMPFKTIVPWTIIISGYAVKGLVKEATSLYNQMDAAGLKPDEGTLISVLAACAESGLLGLGRKVHASIERTRFKWSIGVSNALVDMYAKCGSMHHALAVFNSMPKRDLISWNCMIHCLAMHGHGEEALWIFSRMKQEGFRPDKVTLVAVLCACTHSGLFDEGIGYFNSMEKDYGLTPQIEHYGCMVDLLGRGGRLTEAFKLVQSMPMEPNAVVWGTLLLACRMHNAVQLAEEVQECLLQLEPSDAGNYSMLSNIFAAAGNWSSVAHVRLQMKSTGIQKPSGASAIELDDEVHEFTVFDKSHPKSDGIYQMIERLREDIQEVCCVP